MRVGTLVKLGDSWVDEDRVLGVVTKIYQDEGRPCCNILFADGCHGTLIYLDELEVV
jgi:prepilin-type processing-associated H-X9-DG protein